MPAISSPASMGRLTTVPMPCRAATSRNRRYGPGSLVDSTMTVLRVRRASTHGPSSAAYWARSISITVGSVKT